MSWLHVSLGVQSLTTFLFVVSVVVLAIIALGNAFSTLTTWAMLGFVRKKKTEWSRLLSTKR